MEKNTLDMMQFIQFSTYKRSSTWSYSTHPILPYPRTLAPTLASNPSLQAAQAIIIVIHMQRVTAQDHSAIQ